MSFEDASRTLRRELGAAVVCEIAQPNQRRVVCGGRDVDERAVAGMLTKWRRRHGDVAWTDGAAGALRHGWVLAVGREAARLWRPDMNITELEGRWGVWEGTAMVMVVRDPLTLRGRREQVMWGEYVDAFFERAVEGEARTSLLPVMCARCSGRLDHVDRDGIGWCTRCKRERDRLTSAVKAAGKQGRML